MVKSLKSHELTLPALLLPPVALHSDPGLRQTAVAGIGGAVSSHQVWLDTSPIQTVHIYPPIINASANANANANTNANANGNNEQNKNASLYYTTCFVTHCIQQSHRGIQNTCCDLLCWHLAYHHRHWHTPTDIGSRLWYVTFVYSPFNLYFAFGHGNRKTQKPPTAQQHHMPKRTYPI